MFIKGIPLIDLHDCDVTNNKLLCNSSDSNDDDSPNVNSIGFCNGPRSYLQTMDSNIESTSRSVALEIGEHSEPYTMSTASIYDPLFNAAGKAPHLNAMIIK